MMCSIALRAQFSPYAESTEPFLPKATSPSLVGLTESQSLERKWPVNWIGAIQLHLPVMLNPFNSLKASSPTWNRTSRQRARVTLLARGTSCQRRQKKPSGDARQAVLGLQTLRRHLQKKRARPGSANQQILVTPRPPTPKPKREIVSDLKASLDVDVKQQKRLELAIKKDVKKVKGLAALEKKVLAADALNEKIQSNLAELNRLDTSQSYHVANGIPFRKLHYYVDESHAGMIDEGIMNKPKPPPPPPPNVTDSDATPVDNDADAVHINADPTIAIDMESDADSTGSNRQKRRRCPKKKSISGRG
eukprot:scaffold44959_cov39-Cyclotella_meneghiniana.AAC.7